PLWASVRTHLLRRLSVWVGKREALGDGVEAFEAVGEGDGTWRPLRGIAVPSAEAGDAPSGPGERVMRMRVLLLLGLALEPGDQSLQNGDLGGTEEASGAEGAAGGIAPVHELHDPDGDHQRGRGQPFEGLTIGEQAFLQIDGLRLHGSKQLLD